MIMQVIEQTREERMKMYMKLTKKELVEMLMNNLDFIKTPKQAPIYTPDPSVFPSTSEMKWPGQGGK